MRQPTFTSSGTQILKRGVVVCEVKNGDEAESFAKRIETLLNFAEESMTEDFQELPPFFSMMAGLSIKNRIMKDLLKHAPKDSLERKAAESMVSQTDFILELADRENRRRENSPWAPEGYRSSSDIKTEVA